MPNVGQFMTMGVLLDVTQTWYDMDQVRFDVGQFKTVGALVSNGQTWHGMALIWPT